MGGRVAVFIGGEAVPAIALADVPVDAFVIAADSGIEHALAAGRHVDVAVGDFDSVAPDALAEVVAAGAEVVRHPTDKDATDFELALDLAMARGPDEIVVVGGAGGRVDHFVGNALLLASARYAGVPVRAVMGEVVVHVVHDRVTLRGAPGDTVSLFPVHGPARGVWTRGLRWALVGETLEPGSSRGVSNELAEPEASVEVADGTVVVVQSRGPAE